MFATASHRRRVISALGLISLAGGGGTRGEALSMGLAKGCHLGGELHGPTGDHARRKAPCDFDLAMGDVGCPCRRCAAQSVGWKSSPGAPEKAGVAGAGVEATEVSSRAGASLPSKDMRPCGPSSAATTRALGVPDSAARTLASGLALRGEDVEPPRSGGVVLMSCSFQAHLLVGRAGLLFSFGNAPLAPLAEPCRIPVLAFRGGLASRSFRPARIAAAEGVR